MADNPPDPASMPVGFVIQKTVVAPRGDALLLPARKLSDLLNREAWPSPYLGQRCIDFSSAKPKLCQSAFGAADDRLKLPVHYALEYLHETGSVCREAEMKV